MTDDDSANRTSLRNLVRLAEELREAVDDEELQDMINQSDKDGDGEINVDESYRIMKIKFLESYRITKIKFLGSSWPVAASCRCCCYLLLVSCCSMLHMLPPPPS